MNGLKDRKAELAKKVNGIKNKAKRAFILNFVSHLYQTNDPILCAGLIEKIETLIKKKWR